jgi:S-methylmethionine-dependent homocysteine/selenocysteine methylase
MLGELISKAVFCAAEARRLEGMEGKVLLAGCLPPLGESYQPATLAKEVMVKQYQDIIKHLVTSTDQVDVLLCETMSSAGEALACLEAAERSGVLEQTPLWVSFTIEDRLDCPKLRGGEDLQSAVKALLEHNEGSRRRVKAVLVNCSAPASATVALKLLARAIQEATRGEDIYIGAYANGFITTTSQWLLSLSKSASPEQQQEARSEEYTKCLVKQPEADYDEDTGTIKEEAYTKHVMEWLEIHPSVKVVGGCCGIGVSHIKHLNEHIRAR